MNHKWNISLLTVIGSVLILIFSNHKTLLLGRQVEEMKSPAGPECSEPNLHIGIDGNIYLSWIETHKDNWSSLFFSTLKNNEWSKPNKIKEGENWFVNWADFPSISSFGNGFLASHFLVEKKGKTFSYDVNITISNDQGLTWGKPFSPHLDHTATEHGFVSMVPYMDDQFLAVWLDGRKYSEKNEDGTSASNEMTLRSAVINKSGQIQKESLVDGRVCSCCQTDAALTSTGPIVVYRDRSEDEIRDIALVKLINGQWTEPQLLFRDNWEIAGCPVNGPAIDAQGNLVAVAWFTAANKLPMTKAAFSTDGGQTFGKAMVISEGNPEGRVDLTLLDDGSALISWLESSDEETMIKARRIKKEGPMDEIFLVAKSSKTRSSGFPRMVVKNDNVYFAWTQVGKTLSIRTAHLKLNGK
jgi:hypothetical protein